MDWLTVWVARLAWFAVAIVGGSAVSGALDGRTSAVRWVAGVACWTAWAVATTGLLIKSVRTLTVVRIAAPLSAIAVLVTALGGADAVELAGLAVPAAVATAAVFSAEFGRSFVQASAYGDEDRFPLRVPVAVAIVAVIAWVLWAAAIVAGPLLLAARSWIAGLALTLVAVAATVVLPSRWHRLSRRWLVYVPAGIVVHDPVVLADTLTLRRAQVAGIRLAPADTQAADLTGPASGHALEVRTTESVTAVVALTPRERSGRAIHLSAFLVCPSRPGRALASATARNLPTG